LDARNPSSVLTTCTAAKPLASGTVAGISKVSDVAVQAVGLQGP